MKTDVNKLVIEAYRPELFNSAGIEYGKALSVQSLFHKQMDELLREVLRKLLDREPGIEDAKDCAIIFAEGLDFQFDLAYKGAKLGTVTWGFNFSGHHTNTFNATFTPVLNA